MTAHQRRIRDHELLFELYRIAMAHADLIARVESPRAQEIKEICESVAREKVLDRILNADA